ncbi:hypothetical protein ACHAWX_003358 [Stephanocyclus meneghinianus]
MPKKASVKKAKQQQQQQQQQKQQQQQQPQRKTAAATELSTFSLAAAIEEARASSHSSNTASSAEPQTQELPQPRKIFNIPSPLRKKQTSQSYQSIATNSSYNTAHDSAQNTPAVSYFVDSSDEDNEPTVKDTAAAITSSSPTNSEIIFASNPEEETTMSIKSTKTTPVTKAAPSPVPIVSPPAPKPVLVVAAPPSDPHYDVAQHVYAHAKDIWARGKTLPVLSHLLGITEAAANKLLEVALHTDLPAIDADVAAPNLKKLDDAVVTPVILKIWSILGPAVSKGEEMIVRPVVEEVLPKILESVGMGDKKKNKTTEKSSSKVDDSPNPEYTSAPMVN